MEPAGLEPRRVRPLLLPCAKGGVSTGAPQMTARDDKQQSRESASRRPRRYRNACEMRQAILDLGPDLRRGTSTCQFEGAVLTDIEGSSRLWENAPTAMPEAIARQYEILDEVIARSVEPGRATAWWRCSRALVRRSRRRWTGSEVCSRRSGLSGLSCVCGWRCTLAPRGCATRATTSRPR